MTFWFFFLSLSMYGLMPPEKTDEFSRVGASAHTIMEFMKTKNEKFTHFLCYLENVYDFLDAASVCACVHQWWMLQNEWTSISYDKYFMRSHFV